jgi:heat shock protein HslJ
MVALNLRVVGYSTIVAVLTLTACSQQPPSLAGTSWQAISIEGQATHHTVRSTIRFLATKSASTRPGGRIIGRTGCDAFSGTYRQDGAKLTINLTFGKRRGCVTAPGRAQEPRYVAAIAKVRAFKRVEGQLLLLAVGGTTLVAMKTPTAAN